MVKWALRIKALIKLYEEYYTYNLDILFQAAKSLPNTYMESLTKQRDLLFNFGKHVFWRVIGNGAGHVMRYA